MTLSKSSFIAIGVGQGDAFFFRRGRRTALIDGGRSTYGFPSQFSRVTGRRRVDIVVCTHNDADHAGGIIGFLESGMGCKEVWLPASWTDRLRDILLSPTEFIEELFYNIANQKDTPDIPSLESWGEKHYDRIIEKRHKGEVTVKEELYDILGEDDVCDREIKEIVWNRLFWPLHPWVLNRVLAIEKQKIDMFIEALLQADRIRKIALAAYHSGAEIRWFEVDNSSRFPVTKDDFLYPLNARKIVKIRQGRWSALEFLALTRVNRESLVLLSPATNENPGVLFTSDSDLSFAQDIPWADGMIITAPHHGAESNARAYKRFITETNNSCDVIWVRSDCKSKSRPGNSFLNAPGRRFCTVCRNSPHPKQDVRFIVRHGTWRPVKPTRPCECR